MMSLPVTVNQSGVRSGSLGVAKSVDSVHKGAPKTTEPKICTTVLFTLKMFKFHSSEVASWFPLNFNTSNAPALTHKGPVLVQVEEAGLERTASLAPVSSILAQSEGSRTGPLRFSPGRLLVPIQGCGKEWVRLKK